MPSERATTFQGVQIGVETVSGTGVAANKKLSALSISPSIKAENSVFVAMGNKYPTVAAANREWSEAGVEGQATYTEIVYPLSGILGTATITTAGTAGKKWVWTPAQSAADAVKTYTVEQGSAERAHKMTFGTFTEFGIEFSRGGIPLSGGMIGQAITDNITLTASPTAVALVPVLPSQVKVYLADTFAGLSSATALARTMSVKWTIGNRYAPIWVLNGGTSFGGVVETVPEMTAELRMEADAEGMALLTTMRNSAMKFLRIEAIGALLPAEASTTYLLRIDMAGFVSEPQDFSDEDGLYAIGWTLRGANDPTSGKSVEVTVQNMLAAL